MKKRKVDDGVFIKEHLSVNPDGTVEQKKTDVMAILKKVTPAITPSDWIARTRAEAERLQAHTDRYPDPDDNAQAAVDLLLARLFEALEQAENSNDEATRLYAAFYAGARWQELFIRFTSTSLHAGQQSTRGGREAGEEKRNATRGKYAVIQNAFDELQERSPHLSKEDCYRILEHKHGWSKSTIRRALKK